MYACSIHKFIDRIHKMIKTIIASYLASRAGKLEAFYVYKIHTKIYSQKLTSVYKKHRIYLTGFARGLLCTPFQNTDFTITPYTYIYIIRQSMCTHIVANNSPVCFP